MSHAVIAWGRFNPPTEEGHGKLVKAVQDHAEKVGGKHYVFPTHTQDKKKNPMTHEDKVSALRSLFPKANVVSHGKVKTIIDAMKHLESKGHKEVTVVAGSDRVDEYHGLLNKYRSKEFPNIKKVHVVSAGQRDPDAEGAEGMSASKLRGLVSAGKKEEFVSHYSDKKLGAKIHDKVKAGLQMESTSPIGIFLLGGPGSGKDYVLKNIFSRFDLTEVQADQILNGSAAELLEQNANIVINGALDSSKISVIKSLLENYHFDFVHVSVTNKVSRLRNEQRDNPLPENKRIQKFLAAEKLAVENNAFVFKNSINLNESSEFERIIFSGEIEKLLERICTLNLEMKEVPEPKSFFVIREKVKEPTGNLKNACWKGYTAVGMKTKNGRKVPNCVPVKEQVVGDLKKPHSAEEIAAKHNVPLPQILKALEQGKKVEKEHTKDEDTAEIIALAHLWEKPDYYKKLKQVEQFDAVEQSKLSRYHGASSSRTIGRANRLRKHTLKHHNTEIKGIAKEELELDEMQLVGTDEYRQHAINMTPGQSQTIHNGITNEVEIGDCGCESDCDCDDVKNEESEIDLTPNLSVKKKPTGSKPNSRYNARLAGLSVVSSLSVPEETQPGRTILSNLKFLGLNEGEKKPQFMPTPQQVPAPPGGLPVPKGFKRVKDNILGTKLVPVTVKEAVEYHLENKISFTENAFRPGSEMFFEMLKEAKRLYKEGAYEPKDEWEQDLLDSDVGEFAAYEGSMVPLDYPVEEELNEEDKTDGKGIGKPWREGGGGAVYVRDGDSIRKVSFSKSGMKKKYMDPAATRSFVARHRCLTNKDKTSASYWACRWPRFFSNSGKTWW